MIRNITITKIIIPHLLLHHNLIVQQNMNMSKMMMMRIRMTLDFKSPETFMNDCIKRL